MTDAQQSALAALVGRPLTAPELYQLGPLVAIRNDVAIAALLSVGRKVLTPRAITARGVRAAVPIVDAVNFLALLKDTATTTSIPAWLTTTLSGLGIPADQHFAYFDTVGCAHEWLQQEAGIDLGTATARSMLDLIALAKPALSDTVAVLKALGQRDDPIPYPRVSDALNAATPGVMTL